MNNSFFAFWFILISQTNLIFPTISVAEAITSSPGVVLNLPLPQKNKDLYTQDDINNVINILNKNGFEETGEDISKSYISNTFVNPKLHKIITIKINTDTIKKGVFRVYFVIE